MDMNKEREAFEKWFEEANVTHWMQFSTYEDGSYQDKHTATCWDAWQAAKASAVPEGYVVVPKDELLTVIGNCSDAICGEETSFVFDSTGEPSTWYDHHFIAESKILSIIHGETQEAAQDQS